MSHKEHFCKRIKVNKYKKDAYTHCKVELLCFLYIAIYRNTIPGITNVNGKGKNASITALPTKLVH